MTASIIPPPSNACISCGAKMKGNYCSQCGEKRLNPEKDYALHKFIEQTVDGFTHFDSKFLRSFKALLFKPGFLTLEFIKGRRIRYMKPVQIFIIACVLFYFVFPTVSTFFASVRDIQKSNRFNFDVTRAIQKKLDSDSTTVHLEIKHVETEAAHKSKAYLFLIIPFWGIAFYLLFWKSNPFLVPHIVFAAHNLSFLIILLMVYYLVTIALRIQNVGDSQLIPLAIIYITYLFIAIRKVYQRKILWSVITCLASFAAFIFLFIIYRQGITIWALS